ncbi:hypothetical protein NM688_g6652 [Phlebia brevispora]|uniref:Uncharacterized protein n=1 Tax=Phlebia brevispora TaxID=194682 RepID=A0ACC1SDZ0_9APHY|nr:hypothetical protein NM688_g6652 [Phlebia brevispora]
MSTDYFLPGQPIPVPKGPAPQTGTGIYARDGQLRASVLGVPQYHGSTLSISRTRPHPPAPNSVVLGTVTRLSPLQAVLSITVVDDVPLPAGEEFTGVIRVQDVRATEKDKVKIADCFRGGDVVKGLVISLGDARSYYVTTARNDLGVIFATSEADSLGRPARLLAPPFLQVSFRLGFPSLCFHPAMTAAMQAVDGQPVDGLLSPQDDNFSLIDWKAKAKDLEKILSETRAELQDFQITSKQLEEELEQELDRTEKAQQDLQIKAARADQEKEEWKSKFMTLQTTHNTTTTSLQRELDTLRKEHQQTKVQLRELEMGNDDLERNERAISSSLADVEQRYARVLEEKILLEQDLYDKANVEEECQRLKDELRDANEEIGVLKEQLAAAHDRAPAEIPPSLAPSLQYSDDEDTFLSRRTSQDLQLEELTLQPATSAKEVSPIITTATPRASEESALGRSTLLQRAGFQPRSALGSSPSSIPSPLSRSSTAPGSSTPSRLPPRTPIAKPPLTTRNVSNASTTSSIPGTSTRSKGVQMVSEMRARVKVLEQKIHTRVPRIRMGSVSNTASTHSAPKAGPSGTASPTASSSKSSHRSASPDKSSTLKPRRQSTDKDGEKTRTPAGDASSGWVLIMEDSPTPVRDKTKEYRRISGPNAPSAFRPFSSVSASPQSPTESRTSTSSALSQSQLPTGIRRPQSRLSEGRSSTSTNATTSTTSSIPTPVSRPATPTFLPVPTSGLYHSQIGAKRSTGPSSGAYSQPKRSSLGSSTSTIRPPATKLSSPSRPRFTTPSVKKTGGDDFSDAQVKNGRSRAGSATLLFSRLGS